MNGRPRFWWLFGAVVGAVGVAAIIVGNATGGPNALDGIIIGVPVVPDEAVRGSLQEGAAMVGLGTQELIILGIIALPFLLGCVVAVLYSTRKLGPKHGTKRDRRNDDDMDE